MFEKIIKIEDNMYVNFNFKKFGKKDSISAGFALTCKDINSFLKANNPAE